MQARRIALKRRQARDLDQVLAPQVAHTHELLVNEGSLAVLRLNLLFEPADLVTKLADALVELCFLAVAGDAAQLEQLVFAEDHPIDIRIGGARGNVRRKVEALLAVALPLEPRLPRSQFIETFHDDQQVGARHCLVEAHHHVAGLHPGALAHVEFADHAAGRVLHLLGVAVDHQRTGTNDGAGQCRGGGPAADAAGEKDDGCEAGAQVLADRERNGAQWLAVHGPAPSVTTLSGTGVARGCIILASSASFGPKACWRPSPITISWSTPASALVR